MNRNREYRRDQRERVINNRKRLMRDTDMSNRVENEDNRLNKRHPYDCGNPECYVCHPSKVGDEKTISEIRQQDSYKQQILEENDFEE